MKRRALLVGGATLLATPGPLLGRGGSVDAGRIDTHHHIVPPFYAGWLEDKGITAGGLAIPTWAPETALATMNHLGVTTAICSVSTPGVHLGDDGEAAEMARRVNEYAAEMSRRHPKRFGFFATLTLPDVDQAIKEARHALDELNADGVVVLANVNGTYFGDPEFAPLMETLNERDGVVFIHPSSLPGGAAKGIPFYVADFLLDTTRAAINICRSGWLERYPNVRIILSHGGGFVPYASMRIATHCSPDGSYAGGIARLKRFYYDTALSSSEFALPTLTAFADPERITFGSDWPYAKQDRSAHFADQLASYSLTAQDRSRIDRDNALKLFPRFA